MSVSRYIFQISAKKLTLLILLHKIFVNSVIVLSKILYDDQPPEKTEEKSPMKRDKKDGDNEEEKVTSNMSL